MIILNEFLMLMLQSDNLQNFQENLTSSVVLHFTGSTLWLIIFVSLLLGVILRSCMSSTMALILIIPFTILGDLITLKNVLKSKI